MPLQIKELPFSLNSLEPMLSVESLSFHYGKHHKKYVENLNELIKGTPYEKLKLNEIILWSALGKNLETDDKVFKNASQHFSHEFFWNCLTPEIDQEIPADFKSELSKNFKSIENFKMQFTEEALGLFGSGWVWLTKNTVDQKLEIVVCKNAENPLVLRQIPLLCFDVWEHSYYLDYKNDRKKYIENLWKIVNWKFLSTNFFNPLQDPL